MNVTTLRDLRGHMEWADALVWSAARSCEAAHADARVRDLLYHVHMVQRAFLRTWRHEPRDQPYPTFDALPLLLAWARDGHAEIAAHLAMLTDRDVAAPMPVAWADMVETHFGRVPAPTTLGETILQVVLHSQYHRGQVNARLRELGATPPLVDYIAWLWFGRPAPEWPAIDD
jgi:uncharacterized damage-inducible protein DinB